MEIVGEWLNAIVNGKESKACHDMKACIANAKQLPNTLLDSLCRYLPKIPNRGGSGHTCWKWSHTCYGGQPRTIFPLEINRDCKPNDADSLEYANMTANKWELVFNLYSRQHLGMRQSFDRIGIRIRLKTGKRYLTGWLLMCTLIGYPFKTLVSSGTTLNMTCEWNGLDPQSLSTFGARFHIVLNK